MISILFFIILTTTLAPPLYAQIDYSAPLDIVQTIETNISMVTILVDTIGNKFVIKQRKKIEPTVALSKPSYKGRPCNCINCSHFGVVTERLGIFIAQKIGVPHNKVTIIGAGQDFIGKYFLHFPATLHTFVTGKRVDLLQGRVFPKLDIKQRWYPYDIPHQKRGLCLEVIKNMAQHKDLPSLVAFDTFIGNADRSRNNFFYDEKNDTFYGIDVEASFHKNLCKIACKRIQEFLNGTYILNPKEYKALKRYNKILANLINTFPPEVVCNLYDTFSYEAGFYPGSDLYTPHIIKERINLEKNIIKESYDNAKTLHHLLQQLKSPK